MAEAEVLRSRGLALGAVLEHAIVFADDGPMSPLRFADEPVRHKALDAVGDLALLGRPLEATVTIERGSHRLHHALMLELARTPSRPATLEP
jgi:UDP-3-O-[3-hydroxymyristoyl] N-acetylglucosamine deacetylase